ncbi:MAG: hypothetical protein K2N64_01485 [Anaeroplasmataceae bacterium]|nr:hypothetical protein [Anaeroplasmataceae bacterium]
MLKKIKLKPRRLCLLASLFVLLISLGSCSSAGKPVGNLDKDSIYLSAGNYSVTKGELWEELRWSANTILTDKITEVVMKDYVEKVELIIDKSYTDLSESQKKLFADNFTDEDFSNLRAFYEERLEDYVIEDIYNFNYSSTNSYDSIKDVSEYDAKKLIIQYSDELYSNYNIKQFNNQDVQTFVTEAVEKRENYLTIAKELKSVYYLSLAKELLAYSKLEEDIKDAFDNRDPDNEDDLGYFTKSEYTNKFKSDFANQSDLNLVLIHFSTEKEYTSTLRSFGLKVYENNLVYIPYPEDIKNFSEYCTYYDELTSNDLRGSDKYQNLNTLAIAQLYIQIYNYLYGGYRNYIYDDSYVQYFDKVEDLIKITEDIREKSQAVAANEEAEVNKIRDALANADLNEDEIGTIYTREDINKISDSFSTYLYETLCLPFKAEADDDSLCYSTSTQSYNNSYWIAFKFDQAEDQYEDMYNKNTIDDDLYDSIAANEELKAEIEKLLKRDKMLENSITNAVKERTDEVKISIYDEALEIAYATSNAGYSKTYGKAPNKNVIATLKYDNKTWNLNIVSDDQDQNALDEGVFDILERTNGITTAIDILSKKVVKGTKAYADTEKDTQQYKEALEFVLAAFSNDYYSTSGYPSSIGKYNFMMLYFHSVDINHIVSENYRVNAAAAKLLTNYNSNQLLEFFKSYSDNIYSNHFSIGGKRLVVFRDADDDSKKDDVSTWTEHQKRLAQQLIRQIYNEVSSTTGAHADALSTIVSEIQDSARAKFEDNPIAPENKWAEYRKAGLSVELEDVTADNSTTSLDFKLKQRLYDIFYSSSYSIVHGTDHTIPTEYMEDLQDPNTTILETKDGYNLLLITSADFQTSAKFTEEDDKLKIFENLSVYYNEEYHQIGSVYNEEDKLSLEQIRLYVLEYVSSSTSNLSPSNISSALSSFLSPVISRYTANETQRDIVIYLIETKAGPLQFTESNIDRYERILEINHSTADDYISIYFEEDTTNTLKTYENWWTDLQKIVADILLTEGEDA